MKYPDVAQPIIAGIDIGTNTILMAIGYKNNDGSLTIFHDEVQFARLGNNVDKTGIIEEARIIIAEQILRNYAVICESFSVDCIYAVATSAMRDAINGKEVQLRLEKAIGTSLRIIQGEEEARLCFLGTVPQNQKAMVIDIGGGSTEIIIGSHGTLEYIQSINIGAVRLTERYFHDLPPSQSEINQALETIQKELVHLPTVQDYAVYCVAGTPVTLARIALGLENYDAKLINGYELSYLVITIILQQLLHSTREEIIHIQGVEQQRADILPAGTLILDTLLRHCAKQNCFVSTGGVRYGLIMHHSMTQVS